jgi:hypothetical protein
MEVIKKIVSLEPFRSRIKSVIPFVGMYDDNGEVIYNPGLNWGKIPYDVDFPELVSSLGEREAVNLYGNGIKQLGRMTFQAIMEKYHSVSNKKVNFNNLSDEEIEKLRSIVAFIDSKKVIDPPTIPTDPCCTPCPEPSPEIVYDMDEGDYYKLPTMYMNVCIVQSANIIGAYTFATKNWVPGKRYFAGDKVIYDGKTFKLKEFPHTSHFEGNGMKIGFLTGSSLNDENFKDYAGLSDDLFTVVNDTPEMVELGLIYAKIGEGENWTYYIRPSWGGYVNPYDGNTYFDKLLTDYTPELGFKTFGQYETTHWVVDDKIISHGVYFIPSLENIGHDQDRHIGYDVVTVGGNSSEQLDDTVHWESKLVNFKRNTKTITKDGVELQGKLNNLTQSTVLDLQYLIGTIKNIDTSGDDVFGDYLAEIQFIPDHNGLISIYRIEEYEDGPHQGTAGGEQYEFYNYFYDQVEVLGPSENFIGSIENNGNSFTIYDEYNNEVFVAPRDMETYENKISITIGDTEIIAHQMDEGETTVGGQTVKTRPGKMDLTTYSVTGIADGDTSCNGGGFTMQPTGGTESEYDIIAENLANEYDLSTKFIKFQTLDSYEQLVANWAGPGSVIGDESKDETGWIVFTYYIGATLEKEKNPDGTVDKDARYVYNGGNRPIIYKDRYRFRARYDNPEIEIPGGDSVRTAGFVWIDIDYDSAKQTVELENVDNYYDRPILSQIQFTKQSMTEGGEEVSPDFQNADYFMEDYQLGMSFVSNNNSNVYIDRGSAAAFERHMRLSEVDTLQDLENYGNGMFKLKE